MTYMGHCCELFSIFSFQFSDDQTIAISRQRSDMCCTTDWEQQSQHSQWALNKEWQGQHLQCLRCLFGAFPNVKFWLPSTFHPFNQSALDDGRTWALPQERWKYGNSWERIFFIVKAWNWTCQLNKSSPTFNSNDSLRPVQNCVKLLRISLRWREYRQLSAQSFLATLVALHFTPVSESVGHSFGLA